MSLKKFFLGLIILFVLWIEGSDYELAQQSNRTSTYGGMCAWLRGDFNYKVSAPTDWFIGGCNMLCYVKDEHFEQDQSQLQNCTKITNQDQRKCYQKFWGGFVVSESGRIRLNARLKDGDLRVRPQYTYYELYPDSYWRVFYRWLFYKDFITQNKDYSYPVLWHESLIDCSPEPLSCAQHIVYKHEWAETHCKDMTKEEAKRLWEKYVNK